MNIPVHHGLLLAALEVADEAESELWCNCTPQRPGEPACDGTCTHAKARAVKEQLESLLTAHGLH